MQKILSRTRVIVRKVNQILKIRRRRRRRRRRRKWFFVEADEATTSDSDSTTITCENPNVYKSLILECPKCSWHDYYKICPICDHQIPINIKHLKEDFSRCRDCGAITYENFKTFKRTFYSST